MFIRIAIKKVKGELGMLLPVLQLASSASLPWRMQAMWMVHVVAAVAVMIAQSSGELLRMTSSRWSHLTFA